MSMADINLREAEQKALADQALAQFAADAGITLEPGNGQGTEKPLGKESIGPVTGSTGSVAN